VSFNLPAKSAVWLQAVTGCKSFSNHLVPELFGKSALGMPDSMWPKPLRQPPVPSMNSDHIVHRLLSLACVALFSLAGCGGGGQPDAPTTLTDAGNHSSQSTTVGSENTSGEATGPTESTGGSASTGVVAAPPPTTISTPVQPVTLPFVCNDPKALTCVEVASTDTGEVAVDIPLTFGMPFRAGEMSTSDFLTAVDASGRRFPVQMDGVSTRSDGFIRMAVLSMRVPQMVPGSRRVVHLYKATSQGAPVLPDVSGYDLKIEARTYQPQISRVLFGDRKTPFLVGEEVTLKVGDDAPITVTITPEMSGADYQVMMKITLAFLAQINAKSTNYKATNVYETLYIKPIKPDAPPYTFTTTYSGKALLEHTTHVPYAAPAIWRVDPAAQLAAQRQAATGKYLSGEVANEYTLVQPFLDAKGVRHPQLTARLHTRFYGSDKRARTDMVIENSWAYGKNPGNLTYELTATYTKLDTRVKETFTQKTFTHNHHSRWHKVLWHGAVPQGIVRYDLPYLAATKVTWNYDYRLDVSAAVAQDFLALTNQDPNQLSGKKKLVDTSVMGNVFIQQAFGGTGGRPEIGPYPRWTALFLISQDERARKTMLANADAAGVIPIHYRDEVACKPSLNDLPINLDCHPGVALELGTSSPKDALPAMVDSVTGWGPDRAHQGSFVFIPYLVTGDAFYLDELMFWASYNMGSQNPGYRNGSDGLMFNDQIRGQAWAIRSIGEAVRALPDAHPAKAYYKDKLVKNLTWYTDYYSASNPKASPLGAMNYGGAAVGPWQQDFFSIVMAQLVADGIREAETFFEHANKFGVGRFTKHPDFCIQASPGYYFTLVDASNNWITSWRELYLRNLEVKALAADADSSCTSKMTVNGYPGVANGYAAYAKAMLAAAANLDYPGAKAAYTQFDLWTQGMRSAYKNDPTWAIVPWF
jgi:hypothetical protein